MSWATRIEGFEQLTPELRLAARLGIHDGLEVLGIEGTRMVQDNIAQPYNGQPPAVYLGDMMRKVSFSVLDTDPFQTLTIGGGTDHDAPQETGTKPFMPPSSVLVLWVKKKFGVESESEAKGLAFVVARSIAKKGIKGHEMFSRALASLQPLAVPALEKAIATRLAAAGFTGAA